MDSETVGHDVGRLRTKWPRTKLVALAGGAGARDLHELSVALRKQGADKVLKTPVAMDGLIELVEVLLGGERARPRALVIEDSKTYRAMLSPILESDGFQVSAKETMEEAFEAANLAATELIMSDIFMPGEGGIGGIRKIRDNRPGTCIIAVSGGWEGMSTEQTQAATQEPSIGVGISSARFET